MICRFTPIIAVKVHYLWDEMAYFNLMNNVYIYLFFVKGISTLKLRDDMFRHVT